MLQKSVALNWVNKIAGLIRHEVRLCDTTLYTSNSWAQDTCRLIKSIHNCLTLQRYTYSPCNYLFTWRTGRWKFIKHILHELEMLTNVLKYLSSIDTYTQLSVTTNLFTLKHSFIWKESSSTSELMSIRVVLPSIKDKVCSKLSSNPHAPNPLQLTHCTPSICVVFDGKPELPQWRLLL